MPLDRYTTFEDSNIGGIACDSIILVAEEDIHTETATEVAYLQASQIYFTEDTAQHNEAQKTNAQGELFEQQIGFNIPKNRTEIRDWLTANHRRYFYVQYIDKNGYAIELPIMRLLARYSTGEQARNMNGFEFRLQGNTIAPAREARALVNPPIMSISPTSLVFGTVKTGTTKTATFTVNNIGEQPLTISSLNLPAGYTASALPAPIGAGGSHTFTITFAPTVGVSYNGTITVNSNAVSGANTVAVTGLGFVEIGLKTNGTSNYAQAPYSAGNTFAHTSNYTYSFYMRLEDVTTGQIVMERETATNSQTFNLGLGRIEFIRQNGGNVQHIRTGTFLAINTLYRIDLVCEGATASNLKIYVNGTLRTDITTITNNAISGTPSTALNFMRRGGGSGSLFTRGTLYYVRAYNKALSASEIAEQDSLTIPATAVANLVAHWNIQEAQGSSTLVEQISANNATVAGYTLGDLNVSRVTESNTPI